MPGPGMVSSWPRLVAGRVPPGCGLPQLPDPVLAANTARPQPAHCLARWQGAGPLAQTAATNSAVNIGTEPGAERRGGGGGIEPFKCLLVKLLMFHVPWLLKIWANYKNTARSAEVEPPPDLAQSTVSG